MTDIFNAYITCFSIGIAAGFVLGFISWGLGFAIYGIIKVFKT